MPFPALIIIVIYSLFFDLFSMNIHAVYLCENMIFLKHSVMYFIGPQSELFIVFFFSPVLYLIFISKLIWGIFTWLIVRRLELCSH